MVYLKYIDFITRLCYNATAFVIVTFSWASPTVRTLEVAVKDKDVRAVRLGLAAMLMFGVFAVLGAVCVYVANHNGVEASTDYTRCVWLFVALSAVALALFSFYGTRTGQIHLAWNYLFARLSGYYKYDRELYSQFNG